MDEWLKKMKFNGILCDLEKEGNPVTCTMWRKLEDVMLSEISQSQKDTYYMIPWNGDIVQVPECLSSMREAQSSILSATKRERERDMTSSPDTTMGNSPTSFRPICFHSYEVSKVIKIIATESKMWLLRGGERGGRIHIYWCDG
jgi:hypothetical protein